MPSAFLENIEFWWRWITPLSLLLYLGAFAGHTAIHVYWLNWLLGWPIPKWVSRPARKINTWIVVAGPFIMLWIFAANLPPQRPYDLQNPIALYVAVCWVVGFLVAPIAQLHYWLNHRRPHIVRSSESRVYNIAAELGYTPYGHGRHDHLAYFPGNQIFQVEFTTHHIYLPQIPPAWDGMSILHVTDLHFKGVPDKAFYAKVMDHCAELNPDIVALTGDIVDSPKHYKWMLPVLGRLRWQTAAFAILGNHDLWYEANAVRRRLGKLGMHYLGNNWVKMNIRGHPLIVIGNETPWIVPASDLAGCPEQGFRLCLSHTPDTIAWARRHRIDLMLSGHNHGGQIRFPLFGSMYVPSRYSRRFDCGTFLQSPTLLHVSRGLAGQHPLRYHCRPEISMFILHPE